MAAVQLAWSGGQVVVWQGGQVVYTLVGDGDPADVLAAARSLPVSHPSFWDRVKNRSERLLRGLAAR